ncbi:beta-lactamase regulator AmpE [Colwellia sp. D2M02]|uniref:beta-lactamase regulator AmpE n=1 Tax=Colwellia sp. D2M02 TaxID=2841562 RepID=UPI001C09D021|nr:beta-lactamase regulator AmpE [Colwellia sp. D2M02]MBU2894105.1 beta-lactamase regulator AmpE [Colwellia sp. D2M02]
MSLISLLIAIALERSLSSSRWGFYHYFQWYQRFFDKNTNNDKPIAKKITATDVAFIAVPVVVIGFLLSIIDNGLIHVALSTVILIVCLGCADTRKSYKNYLTSAANGEETTMALHHQQLLTDKNLPAMGFGQALVWLNYRYYVAITLFFVVFGAAGAVFYRLLTSVIEQQNKHCQDSLNTQESAAGEELLAEQHNAEVSSADVSSAESATTENEPSHNDTTSEQHESTVTPRIADGCNNHHDILFWVDWLPVRITSFGYMFVGHFSKAMPVWLENCFDFNKPTQQVLIDVAEKSEDIFVDEGDCTAEPCLLVRLAKRNALFVLAVIAILTLTGVLA